jgi:hypothetical protein
VVDLAGNVIGGVLGGVDKVLKELTKRFRMQEITIKLHRLKRRNFVGRRSRK